MFDKALAKKRMWCFTSGVFLLVRVYDSTCAYLKIKL